MGTSRFDSTAYAAYSSATAGKSHLDYTMDSVTRVLRDKDPKTSFSPKTIKVRESVKSDLNPHPTPIMVALDVSGSMGVVVEACRKGLGTLFEEIIKRGPVSDPHVLALAVGDMGFEPNYDWKIDAHPVQATQFEADPVTIGKQIEDLYLERGGGGNNHESYLGPLYFALMRTQCDAFKEPKPRKGYLFTVGDEQPQPKLYKKQIEMFFGDQPKADMSAAELIAAVERDWNYFHLMVEEGSHMKSYKKTVEKEWRELLGQRAINLSDHTKMAEVIISLIEVTEGRDKDEVTKSWSGGTDLVVAKAIGGLTNSSGSGTAVGPIIL